ncbi:MAG: hypothetical protein PHI63_02150 [Patescibacteria group bacterium]|nr:hypothetical protein [Patescibacteria group bacterium]
MVSWRPYIMLAFVLAMVAALAFVVFGVFGYYKEIGRGEAKSPGTATVVELVAL